jgi:hypothetical protein
METGKRKRCLLYAAIFGKRYTLCASRKLFLIVRLHFHPRFHSLNGWYEIPHRRPSPDSQIPPFAGN